MNNSNHRTIKIFTFIDYYLPGYKAGGPIRTISNMVDQFNEQFEFWIITRDHDFTDSKPYTNIRINEWNQVNKAWVYYASSTHLTYSSIRRLINEVQPHIIYLNSFFSILTRKYLFLRRFGFLQKTPVILAPRGEFSPGALSLDGLKKQIYLTFAQWSGLYTNVLWQASSQQEVQEIETGWLSDLQVHIAPNLPDLSTINFTKHNNISSLKERGRVSFVFVSRISRMKNLGFALQTLRGISGHIEFFIYGVKEDPIYWQECTKLIAMLPSDIHVHYGGSIPHAQVSDILQKHHFFLFPTLGENFGHVIVEALSAGCPVIISERTPWHDVSKENAGWEIELTAHSTWQTILQKCVDMDQIEYQSMSTCAQQFALQWTKRRDLIDMNMQLFSSGFQYKSTTTARGGGLKGYSPWKGPAN